MASSLAASKSWLASVAALSDNCSPTCAPGSALGIMWTVRVVNDQGQTSVPAGSNHVMDIAVGYAHSVALKNDGTVVGRGANHFRQGIPGGNTGRHVKGSSS